ncbi:hypothetical protein O9992_22425 [Vibrio lentus]|nr:hypothetical protein [Vibrio lentus]
MNSNDQNLPRLLVSLPLLCQVCDTGEDDPNASTKQGAVGGRTLGLTIGALTGDAELAMPLSAE